MEKVKITLEQEKRIKHFLTHNNRDYLIMCKLQGFNCLENQCLNKLSLEDFMKAIYYGYEIIAPPAPKLENGKVDVSFNSAIYDLHKDREVFIKIKNNDFNFDVFSIAEAVDIRDTLTEIIQYYKDYVNQNN